MKKSKILVSLLFIVALLSACSNQSKRFSDFDYQSVYFGNQFPVRTLELGEDLFVDNSLDNEHKIEIKATTGGVYSNKKNITINFKVENSLCDGLYFGNSDTRVVPLPSEYYTLAGNQMKITSGSILGGVEVQLTDAFFEDEKSLSNNYVIPLVIQEVEGADTVLRGDPLVANPNRCISSDWSVLPKDFVLYAIKYVNPWHGNYLRRGEDIITKTDGSVVTKERHKEYVEKDEVVNISTNKLTVATLHLTTRDEAGVAVSYDLVLTFDKENNCTVKGNSNSFDISGSGKFVSKGEKNSMGGKDRDAIYLDYKVKFNDLGMSYATKDTLVVRDRGVAPEYFTVEAR